MGAASTFVSDLKTLLQGRDFRRLFAVRLTGQFGDGVFQVALASYVFFSPERQTSAPAAAAAFGIILLPYSLVGPFAGVLLDRWKRRSVLLFANVVRAGFVLAVAVLATQGLAGPIFYATALATMSVNRFILAGLSAALPHVVKPAELVMGNSVSPTSGTIVALIGATGGYTLRDLAGGAAAGDSADVVVLVTTAVIYFLAGLLALRLRRDQLGPVYDPGVPATREALRNVVSGLVAGAQHVLQRPPVAWALGAMGASRFCYGMSVVSSILLFRNHFYDPAEVDAGLGGLAGVFAIAGVGYFTAAALTPIATERMSKPTWITVLLLASAVVTAFPTSLFTRVAIAVAAFLLSLAVQGVKISVDTIVQEQVTDAFRGRVFSLYDMLFNIGFVAAAVLAALTLPPTGKSYPVLFTTAVLYAVTALAYWRAQRPTRQPAVAARD